MWSKKEPVILWTTAYAPLLLLMIGGFLYRNELLPAALREDNAARIFGGRTWIAETLFLLAVLLLSLALYRLVIRLLLRPAVKRLAAGTTGRLYAVRRFEKLPASDYTFFLMTLLLPRLALDYSSVANFAVSLLMVVFIIAVFVRTDTLATCPLFFVSGLQVFKSTISEHSLEEEKADEGLRKEVVLLAREKDLDLGEKYRAVRLAGKVYVVLKAGRS
ncbi:hypothetical protein QWJ34_06795 [Saccharibacillus sp. CPCC 101409]|uniref:hypothetical protein n=1 Tax=Saccharibacillus sp. CPCC 101409 TaxID=3058041 RepID=UPI002671B54A|nr:hypothetical protein [Saccharibacillus sp. CPCC 101409]MDO3409465.1 hypothetical protein [Saccharibacillus sp. CPCC 101409]